MAALVVGGRLEQSRKKASMTAGTTEAIKKNSVIRGIVNRVLPWVLQEYPEELFVLEHMGPTQASGVPEFLVFC